MKQETCDSVHKQWVQSTRVTSIWLYSPGCFTDFCIMPFQKKTVAIVCLCDPSSSDNLLLAPTVHTASSHSFFHLVSIII